MLSCQEAGPANGRPPSPSCMAPTNVDKQTGERLTPASNFIALCRLDQLFDHIYHLPHFLDNHLNGLSSHPSFYRTWASSPGNQETLNARCNSWTASDIAIVALTLLGLDQPTNCPPLLFSFMAQQDRAPGSGRWSLFLSHLYETLFDQSMTNDRPGGFYISLRAPSPFKQFDRPPGPPVGNKDAARQVQLHWLTPPSDRLKQKNDLNDTLQALGRPPAT
ncbi:hypothetical protein PtA15_8A558 [Puccinia triticina]|uniref:Uncharacterized protein n=1 Tax=Puccinia triticina TaxID=208348 RepID=A0ABY7CT70_9BASI|nr:uncharacterized protein PtA15_8A558 [Puccinia triticina]WAQ87652.1 hypothetical protein PtA15_8A558 [Puccinia triticina]